MADKNITEEDLQTLAQWVKQYRGIERAIRHIESTANNRVENQFFSSRPTTKFLGTCKVVIDTIDPYPEKGSPSFGREVGVTELNLDVSDVLDFLYATADRVRKNLTASGVELKKKSR